MNKFKGMSDTNLFMLYKEHDPDAEAEFVERYRAHSIVLAKSLLAEFRKASYAELDDLIGIGLFALYIALSKFDISGDFYPYWKEIATHKMMDEIKATSYSYIIKSALFYKPFRSFSEDYNSPFEYSGVLSDSTFIDNEIKSILNNPNNNISKKEKTSFSLYLKGYTISEIAKMEKCSYSTSYKRIERVRNKLKDILFNS